MTPGAFDRIAIVDWSGGNDTGPRPRRDAIWLGLEDAPPRYLRNRTLAEVAISDLIEGALNAGQRLFLGFDFPFGYPAGFARALTGRADPLAVWSWLAKRLEDSPQANNRFDLAGQINLALGAGRGPFWGNALRRDVPGLPRTKTGYANPFADRRQAEARAPGAFTCWQLSGAGAVGGQVLTGLPVLHRLRVRFPGRIGVWPFDAPEAPVQLVEVWPSLINAAVRAATGPDDIRDAVQVALLARAVRALGDARRAALLRVAAPEEGWIFGLGSEDTLHAAAIGSGPDLP